MTPYVFGTSEVGIDATTLKHSKLIILKMLISVLITEDIMPGVVCLLQGIWPSFDANGMDQAGAANILTSTEPTEPCMGSRTHSVLVEVDRLSYGPGTAMPARIT